MRQMALDLSLPHSFLAADYVVSGSNLESYRKITTLWPSRVYALSGPKGSGKSHLASVWAESSGARRLSARELDLSALKNALVTGALLLEDASEKTASTPFFHLLNMVKEMDGLLLITCDTPPSQWDVTPADLNSRLRAIPYATLSTPDDTLLKAVYMKLFSDRQLDVDLGVIDYLLTRSERSISSASRIVNIIDRLGLEQSRRVSKQLAGRAIESLV